VSALGDAALEYSARGWPVFPLEPRGKRPLGRLAAHGLNDATTSPTKVRAWWRAEPNANIGLRTGVAFDVLDVDGNDGRAALMAHMRELGVGLESGPWAWTGGDGDHLLFLPTGNGNRTGILDHVDWRGAGGYIVAPPSIHPDTGAAYEWETDHDRHGGPDEQLAAVPPWLLRLVAPPTPTGDRAASTTVPLGSAYGLRALEGEVAGVALAPEGQRNHRLNAAAFSLGQLVAAGTLEARAVAEQLLTVALRIGLGEGEAVATIRSGLQKGMATPRRQTA
jgi:hypothetical protein